MGLFDSVYVVCPKCGSKTEFQSKVGDPYCRVFTTGTASTEMLIDILNKPKFCEKCHIWFALIDPAFPPGDSPRPQAQAQLLRDPIEGEFSAHPQGMRWWDAPFTFADLQKAIIPPTHTEKPEPDAVMQTMNAMGFGMSRAAADEFRAELAKRGGRIVFDGEQL